MTPNIPKEYAVPPTAHTVAREDCCPCFSARAERFSPEKICWFCKFASFDLISNHLPEKGTCRYPDGSSF